MSLGNESQGRILKSSSILFALYLVASVLAVQNCLKIVHCSLLVISITCISGVILIKESFLENLSGSLPFLRLDDLTSRQ